MPGLECKNTYLQDLFVTNVQRADMVARELAIGNVGLCNLQQLLIHERNSSGFTAEAQDSLQGDDVGFSSEASELQLPGVDWPRNVLLWLCAGSWNTHDIIVLCAAQSRPLDAQLHAQQHQRRIADTAGRGEAGSPLGYHLDSAIDRVPAQARS